MKMVEQLKSWWNRGLLAWAPICLTIALSVIPFALKQAQLEQSMQDQLAQHEIKLLSIEKQVESLSSQIESLQAQLSRIEDHQLRRAPHKVAYDSRRTPTTSELSGAESTGRTQ